MDARLMVPHRHTLPTTHVIVQFKTFYTSCALDERFFTKGWVAMILSQLWRGFKSSIELFEWWVVDWKINDSFDKIEDTRPNNCKGRAKSEPYTILFIKFSEENVIDHPLFGLLMTSTLAYRLNWHDYPLMTSFCFRIYQNVVCKVYHICNRGDDCRSLLPETSVVLSCVFMQFNREVCSGDICLKTSPRNSTQNFWSNVGMSVYPTPWVILHTCLLLSF